MRAKLRRHRSILSSIKNKQISLSKTRLINKKRRTRCLKTLTLLNREKVLRIWRKRPSNSRKRVSKDLKMRKRQRSRRRRRQFEIASLWEPRMRLRFAANFKLSCSQTQEITIQSCKKLMLTRRTKMINLLNDLGAVKSLMLRKFKTNRLRFSQNLTIWTSNKLQSRRKQLRPPKKSLNKKSWHRKKLLAKLQVELLHHHLAVLVTILFCQV